jgi:16S rRNA (uracil1498-N3)-methyltransferase
LITLLVDPRRFAGSDPAAGAEGPTAADGGGSGTSIAGVPGVELVVEGDSYRHLFRARRLRAGDRLRVVDGEGRARWATIEHVGRHAAAVLLAEPAAPNEPRLRLDLLVTTLRNERAAWLVEKATELGCAAVRFLNTERAPRSFGEGTVARLRRVAAAAVEQCHRARCPEITGPHPFPEIARLAAGAAHRWLLDPATIDPLPAPRGEADPAMESLLVGPEGGWSPAELETLHAAGWLPRSLGPRILRIETAALAAAALRLLAAPQ